MAESSAARYAGVSRTAVPALVAAGPALFALLQLTGSSGPEWIYWLGWPLLVAEIAVIGCVLAGLALDRTSEPQSSPVLLGLVGMWLLLATLANLLSTEPGIAFTFQLGWLVHLAFGLSLWSILGKTRGLEPRHLLYALLVGLLAHSALLYINAALVGDRQPWEAYNVGVTNPRHLVFYAAVLIGGGLGLLQARRDRTSRLFAILCLLAGYHLAAWAGGRAALGLSLLLPFLVAFVARAMGERVGANLFIALAAAGAAFALSLAVVPDTELLGLRSSLSRLFGTAPAAGLNEWTSNRWDTWNATLDWIENRPFLGHGQGQFLQESQRYGFPVDYHHPHNAILQFAFEWGLAGLVCASAAGFLAARRLWSVRIGDPLVFWVAGSALVALALASMFDGSYFFPLPLYANALLLAVLASETVGRDETAMPETGQA